jgi:hypothetical protein
MQMAGTPTIILPWLAYGNQDPVPWLGIRSMNGYLRKAGFKVHAIFNGDGQFLDPAISCPPANDVRFEVALPEGWTIADGYNGYGFADGTRSILDGEGRFRVHIRSPDGSINEGAELYGRYMVEAPDFVKLPFDPPKDKITDVVVDRAAVDYRKPADFPVAVFRHSRPRASGPIDPADFRRACDEDLERIRAGKPKLHPPVFRWLHERYPAWRDPLAYW